MPLLIGFFGAFWTAAGDPPAFAKATRSAGGSKPTSSQATIYIMGNRPSTSPLYSLLEVRIVAPVSTENILASIV